MKIPEIVAGLEDRIDDLVRKLLPNGKKIGSEWDCRSDDSPWGGSVSVVMSGGKKGRVGFWQGRPDNPAENGGDLLHLVYAANGFTNMVDAIAWAKKYLGRENETDEEKAERKARQDAARQAQAREAVKTAERKRQRAVQMWRQASPRLKGTPAEWYFRARGIDLRELAPQLENSMRFAPRLEWWMGAERDGAGRKVRPGPSFPAIVSAIRNARGEQTGVHCTFLAEDGRGKAPVAPAKLMFGEVEGGVIWLTKGETGLSPLEACVGGAGFGSPSLLTLAEGIENGLTGALAYPAARAWAATSLSNLARAPVWLPCVSAVLLARDNDRGNQAAELQFERALAALESHGKPVAVIETTAGADDLNDYVKGSL